MLLRLLAALSALSAAVSAPNERALRILMTDSRFVGLVSPCTVGGNSRTTAAGWLRTAFHDAGSYDEASGTGGIDGSLAFELGFAENAGAFAGATLTQYRQSQVPGVTLSDMIVLGAITAVGSCGGPQVPFYYGRVDAKRPVEEGHLPLPEQSTETHTQQFARMGFSKKEMISLVARGHSIGGVHGVNNPTITTAAMAGFDSTRAQFDNAVATEYIADRQINPLAQPYDETKPQTSSDSRIFAADGNTTMSRYAVSESLFFSDCVSVFSRMFNDAIPRGTALSSEPIEPFPVAIGFRPNLRNGAYHLQQGSGRVYGLAGLWTAFDIVYNERDGASGSDSNLLFVRALRTLCNGETIEIRDFSTRSPGINLNRGISSISVRLQLVDGTTYDSAEAAETVRLQLVDGTTYDSAEAAETVEIDDSVIVDTGAGFTCMYTSPTGVTGLNVTAAVLGPLDITDRVELVYDLGSDTTRTTFGEPLRMTYRAPLEASPYNYYGVFIPSVAALDVGNFAVRVTLSDGTVSIDDRQGTFYWQSTTADCLTGAVVPAPPAPAPQPSNGLSTPSRRSKRDACSLVGLTKCGRDCVDISSDLEMCGACPGEAGWSDCTALEGDGNVECVEGVCVDMGLESSPSMRWR